MLALRAVVEHQILIKNVSRLLECRTFKENGALSSRLGSAADSPIVLFTSLLCWLRSGAAARGNRDRDPAGRVLGEVYPSCRPCRRNYNCSPWVGIPAARGAGDLFMPAELSITCLGNHLRLP